MSKKIIFFGILVLLIASIPTTVTAQEDTTQRITDIQLDDNGDAVWRIEIRNTLQDQSSIDNFETYVSQVNSPTNTDTTQNFQDRFETVIENANNQYDREMRLESLTLNAEITNTVTGDVGITTIEFTWVGYADITDQDDVVIGQILSDGYTLSEGEKLAIYPPENYEARNVPVDAEKTTNGAIQWSGPYSFSDTEIIFTTESSIPYIPIGGLVIFIGLILLGSRFVTKEPNGDNDTVTTELQTDGEKIVTLLQNNDGRMKQKHIRSQLDWSNSKVSRVASTLEQKGVIEKLTIGRENVLSLQEESL